MEAHVRITSKGQVTIPQHVREAAGLRPGMDVEFEIKDGVVQLVKPSREQRLERLKAAADRVRKQVDFKWTTEEYMRMVRGEWPYEGP